MPGRKPIKNTPESLSFWDGSINPSPMSPCSEIHRQRQMVLCDVMTKKKKEEKKEKEGEREGGELKGALSNQRGLGFSNLTGAGGSKSPSSWFLFLFLSPVF